MSHLAAAADRVIAALRGAGVRVTEDPRSLNPPSVLVTIQGAERRSTAAAQVRVQVALIAPGPANLDARRKLDELADLVTPALDAAGLPWTFGNLTTLFSPSSGEPLAAYELTLTLNAEA